MGGGDGAVGLREGGLQEGDVGGYSGGEGLQGGEFVGEEVDCLLEGGVLGGEGDEGGGGLGDLVVQAGC